MKYKFINIHMTFQDLFILLQAGVLFYGFSKF